MMKYLLSLLMVLVLSFTTFAGDFQFSAKMGVVSYDLENNWEALKCPLMATIEYTKEKSFPVGLFVAPVLVNQNGENGTTVYVGLHIPIVYRFGLGYGTRVWNAQRPGGLVNFDANQVLVTWKLF